MVTITKAEKLEYYKRYNHYQWYITGRDKKPKVKVLDEAVDGTLDAIKQTGSKLLASLEKALDQFDCIATWEDSEGEHPNPKLFTKLDKVLQDAGKPAYKSK